MQISPNPPRPPRPPFDEGGRSTAEGHEAVLLNSNNGHLVLPNTLQIPDHCNRELNPLTISPSNHSASGKLPSTYTVCDYSELLEYFHETFVFEPAYYGQAKSPSIVQQTKAGNAFEIAALFNNYLKHSLGYRNTKFLIGKVRLKPERFRKFVGTHTLDSAARIMATGGYLPEVIRNLSGEALYVEFYHVWVKFDDCGFGNSACLTRIVDPTFSYHTIPSNPSLNETIGAVNQPELNDIISKFDNNNGVLSIDTERLSNYFYDSQLQSRNFIETNGLAQPSSFFQKRESYKVPPEDMVVDHPPCTNCVPPLVAFEEVGSPRVVSSFATKDLQRVNINLPGLNTIVNVKDIIEKRLTVTYVPANSDAIGIINAAGGILNVKYKGVSLKPQLKANGQLLKTGAIVKVGEYQELKINYYDATPSGSKRQIDSEIIHNITAGGFYAIVLSAQAQGGENILQNTNYLKNVANVLKNDPFQEAYVGQFLHVIGQNYFNLLDNYKRAIAGANNQLIFSKVSEALISINLTAVEDDTGVYKMAVGSKGIDAPKNSYSIFPFDNVLPNPVPIMASLGVVASSLEHTVFEATSGWRTESTISILRHAFQQDIPVYALNSQNFSTNKHQLKLPDRVILSMEKSIKDGSHIITPAETVNINKFKGYGYIVFDPQTGKSSFLINGGDAGGRQFFIATTKESFSSSLFNDSFIIIANTSDAVLDGIIYGTNRDISYSSGWYSGVAGTSAFVSDLLLVGDIRNIGFTGYDFFFNDGSGTDILWAAVGIVPFGDFIKYGKTSIRFGKELDAFSNEVNYLAQYTVNNEVIFTNLVNKSNLILSKGVTQLKIEGNDIARIDYARDGMDVSNYFIKDSETLMLDLGYDINTSTSRNMKGAFGEKLTNELVEAEGRVPYFSSKHNTNHHGFDNISKDSDGTFVFTEAKFSSSSGDVGASLLSTNGGVKQLTEEWLRASVNNTPNLLQNQRDELLQAIDNGNFRTELVVIKAVSAPKGVAINKNFGGNVSVGKGGKPPISNIRIVEFKCCG